MRNRSGFKSSQSNNNDTTSSSSGSQLNEFSAEPEVSSSALGRIASLIKSGEAKNIVLLLGAGISTSAGIPDFRSPTTGLYHNLQKLNLPFPEAVFELGFFRKRPEPFWTLAKEIYPGKHYVREPTPTHYLLPLLHKHKVLRRVFTQNIDTLETLAGLPPDLIVEAHGSFATSHCLDCGREVDRDEVLRAGVRRGEVVRCGRSSGAEGSSKINYKDKEKAKGTTEGVKEKGKKGAGCGGLVKPDIVFFGEGLPNRFFKLIPELKKCDLLIVIGTSLQVHPFASLVDYVPSSCPRLLINREPVGPFTRVPKSNDIRRTTQRPTSNEGENSTAKGDRKGKDKGGKSKVDQPRDIYWEGDADEGVWELVDALGWRDELESLIEDGRRELKIRYKQSEGVEQTPSRSRPQPKPVSKLNLGSEITPPSPSRPQGSEPSLQEGSEQEHDREVQQDSEKDEGEALEEAIRRQLKL